MLDFFDTRQDDKNPGVFARFYIRAHELRKKSKEMGRPIFEDREYVEIRVQGDSKTVIDREVREEDKRRWPRQYEAFVNGREQPVEGTPIEQWPAISESKRKELIAAGIRTVEGLAVLKEDTIKRLGMDTRELVKLAKATIEQAEGLAPMTKMIADLESKDKEIQALRSELDELKKLVKESPDAA